MSSISADTHTKDSEIWFEIEAIVEVPNSVDVGALEETLRFWTESKDSRAELIFDTFTSQINHLMHA